MGQAKQRGTFEERKAAAIEYNDAVAKLLKEQEQKWWDDLSPEEKEKARMNRLANAYKLIRAGKPSKAKAILDNRLIFDEEYLEKNGFKQHESKV